MFLFYVLSFFKKGDTIQGGTLFKEIRFTDLGGIFKFSAQDSDLEYLFWRCKNPPVSSDLESLLRAYFPNKYTVLGIWNM